MSSSLSHQPQERVASQPQGGSSKLPGQVSHQPGNKVPQTDRSGSVQPSQVKIIPNYHDEFKFGFPSSGLSSATHKWWETTTDEKHVVRNAHGESAHEEEEEEEQSSQLPSETSSRIAIDEDVDNKHGDPATLLASIRKQVAEKGRELLKSGVCKRYSPFKLSKREKSVLSQVFQSSFPSDWKESFS